MKLLLKEKPVSDKSFMREEVLQASQIASFQFKENSKLSKELAEILKIKNPYSIMTMARGSSHHAALFFNYLVMNKLHRISSSLPLSSMTLYKTKLHVSQSLGVAISQSGHSPDIITPFKYFKENALESIALVNDLNSPLAKLATHLIPLHAGEEKSIAATKSFIAGLFAFSHLIASWSNDQELLFGLERLSEDLDSANKMNWEASIPTHFLGIKQIIILGRGPGLPLAHEMALKFKETCRIHAEAFSGAEIKHGPKAMITSGFPVLILALRGPTLKSMLDLKDEMISLGAKVILAAPSFVKNRDLTIHSTSNEELDAITAISSFYLLVENLSRELGFNPDKPMHLSKITKTL